MPSGFFNEPSQIAIGFAPIIYIAICQREYFRLHFRKYTKILILLAIVLSPSTSIIAVVFIAFIFAGFDYFSLKRLQGLIIKVIFPIALIIIYGQKFPNLKNRVESIYVVVKNNKLDLNLNASSLIYIKGFEMAKHAILNYPIGVGLNNMEVLNEYSRITHLGDFFKTRNKDDGSSILFKVVSEFGVFGLFFFVSVLIMLITKRMDIMERAFLFSIVAASVRGAGYFDGVTIIGITVYWFHMKKLSKIIFLNIIKKPSIIPTNNKIIII